MSRFLFLFCLFSTIAGAEPFTYQGQLSDGGSLANGDYDFIFRLYDGSDPNTATLKGSAVTVDDLPVSNGVFTATIDPGMLFDGIPLWLEVSVRPGNSTGSYMPLLPLQSITAAPEAQVSLSVVQNAIGSLEISNGSITNADLADSSVTTAKLANGSVGNSQLSADAVDSGKIADGTVANVDLAGNINPTKISGTAWTSSNDGSGSGLDADRLDGQDSSTFWQTGGNGPAAGAFLGTNNSEPLEFRVNGKRVGVITDAVDSGNHAPNVLLGAENNGINANAAGATVSGGGGNIASGKYATVSGGSSNSASWNYSTVGGGDSNTASAYRATVGGGFSNRASGYRATVGGGSSNIASGYSATVPGGSTNSAGGSYSLAAGYRAKVRDSHSSSIYYSGDSNGDEGTFVWADSTSTDFISTGPNQFLVRANGGMGVGTNSPQAQFHVKDAINDSASLGNHVAIIENNATSTSVGPDVLALKTSATGSAVDDSVNFITFFDGNDNAVGRIEGNGSNAGGVAYFTSGADFAEYLPTEESDLQPGEVVGLHRGHLSRDTQHAERVLVISGTAAFVGAAPPEDKTGDYALVAFMGQVPVKLHGQARPGDWLVASGKNDGHAVARSLQQLQAADMARFIGRALEASRDGQVKALVGLPPQALLAAQQQRLSQLEAENRQQQQQLTAMEAHYNQQLAQLQQALQALQANQRQLLTHLRQAETDDQQQEPAQ